MQNLSKRCCLNKVNRLTKTHKTQRPRKRLLVYACVLHQGHTVQPPDQVSLSAATGRGGVWPWAGPGAVFRVEPSLGQGV